MRRTRKSDKRTVIAASVAILTTLVAVVIPMKTCGGNKADIPEITQQTSVAYVELHNSQAQVETSEPESVSREVTMFTTCNVHLRERDSSTSNSLKVVSASQVVTAYVVDGEDWYEVSYDGTHRYIFSDYLQVYDPQLHIEIGLDYVHQDLVREMIDLFQLDVDEYFIYGMMYTENRFQNEPESKAGAQGILQIIPSTWSFLYDKFQKEYPEYSHLIINDSTDKTSNIILGMYYILYIQHCYGFDSAVENAHTILTAYNRGMSGADTYCKEHGTYETDYSQEILRAAEYIREHKTWKEGL